MLRLKSSRVLLGGVAGVVVALVAIVSTVFVSHTFAAPTPNVTFKSHPVSVNPQMQPAGSPTNHIFGCQTQTNPSSLVCYSPQQIYQAFGINELQNQGITGKGHTVVIIDAFQNPTMQSDLAAFDATFGLPDPDFVQVAPDGLTPFDPNDANQVGWAGEIALDVQWAHAIAPGAKIELVLAKSNQDADILSVTKWAVDHHVGDIISQSFGENENCVDPNLLHQEHAVYEEATARHITIFASSGDQGAAQQTCDGNSWVQVASSPASDPLVTAVGATELFAAPACRDPNTLEEVPCPEGSPAPGTYENEIALNEPAGFLTAGSFSTGGGYSDLYTRPGYQVGLPNSRDGKRGVPDISFTGSINHGVLASCAACAGTTTPTFFIFGGTSVGSPCWGGLAALADQIAGRSLGFISEALYKIGKNAQWNAMAYHDTTVGNNTVQEPDATNTLVTVQGFNATTGWDATTGWGTPKANALLPLLVSVLGGPRH
jgi:subtilase family serine protease